LLSCVHHRVPPGPGGKPLPDPTLKIWWHHVKWTRSLECGEWDIDLELSHCSTLYSRQSPGFFLESRPTEDED